MCITSRIMTLSDTGHEVIFHYLNSYVHRSFVVSLSGFTKSLCSSTTDQFQVRNQELFILDYSMTPSCWFSLLSDIDWYGFLALPSSPVLFKHPQIDMFCCLLVDCSSVIVVIMTSGISNVRHQTVSTTWKAISPVWWHMHFGQRGQQVHDFCVIMIFKSATQQRSTIYWIDHPVIRIKALKWPLQVHWWG